MFQGEPKRIFKSPKASLYVPLDQIKTGMDIFMLPWNKQPLSHQCDNHVRQKHSLRNVINEQPNPAKSNFDGFQGWSQAQTAREFIAFLTAEELTEVSHILFLPVLSALRWLSPRSPKTQKRLFCFQKALKSTWTALKHASFISEGMLCLISKRCCVSNDRHAIKNAPRCWT